MFGMFEVIFAVSSGCKVISEWLTSKDYRAFLDNWRNLRNVQRVWLLWSCVVVTMTRWFISWLSLKTWNPFSVWSVCLPVGKATNHSREGGALRCLNIISSRHSTAQLSQLHTSSKASKEDSNQEQHAARHRLKRMKLRELVHRIFFVLFIHQSIVKLAVRGAFNVLVIAVSSSLQCTLLLDFVGRCCPISPRTSWTMVKSTDISIQLLLNGAVNCKLTLTMPGFNHLLLPPIIPFFSTPTCPQCS